MKISSLTIRNFKSIRELNIENIENALILVGKNNTGKTVVIDAIRVVSGSYQVTELDFNDRKKNIEIQMTLEITEEDLIQLHTHGIVSCLKEYDEWEQEFCDKLPSYEAGSLTFTCIANRKGEVRYEHAERRAGIRQVWRYRRNGTPQGL